MLIRVQDDRVKCSLKMLRALQRLFAIMLKGSGIVADPTSVLELVRDGMNNHVLVGEQRDIVEYLMIFFEHIEAGLKYFYKSKEDVSDQYVTFSQVINFSPSNYDSEQETRYANSLLSPGKLLIEGDGPKTLDKNQNFIAGLFEGRLIWEIFTNKANIKQSSEMMGPLILEAKAGDLETSLKQKFKYEISDWTYEVD